MRNDDGTVSEKRLLGHRCRERSSKEHGQLVTVEEAWLNAHPLS